MTRPPFGSFAALLTVALVLLLGGTAKAATFTVNSTTDAADLVVGDGTCASSAGGQCTLRAAVEESESGGGSDTINVPAGTYRLTIDGSEPSADPAVGDLDLTNDVTINGSTAGAVVVQASKSDQTQASDAIDRVFDVLGAGTDASINDLTLRHGRAGDGGAVRNTGSLTLKRVTISGSKATDTGGGIFNSGSLTVVNSTISGNEADAGGGLASSGTSATRKLTNVTVADNSATDAAGVGGGGILKISGDPTSVKNTIVADNQVGGNPGNCAGGVTSRGHNLDSGNTCNFNQAGDLSNTDPKLGPLEDNGGPSKTHALPADSPAIDAGFDEDQGCPSTDQRGIARPQDGDGDGTAHCDIAAFELRREADLTLTKTDDPDPVRVAEELTYGLTITNNGPSPASNVKVTDTLPNAVDFVSSSPGCSHTNGTVTCNLGNVQPGVADVTIVVKPARVGEVSNQASVVSSTFDSNSGDNSGTETTTVQMSLDPIPSPTSDNTPTYSGIANPDGGTVTVTVKNSGSQVVQTRTANPDPQTGTYSVEGFPGLVDGDYTAQATQDTDSSQVRSFTIDTGGPPPVTETTAFPDSVAVVKGKQVAGDASSLEDDDDDFFSVKPRSDQTRVVWEGLFQSVPNDIDRLEITYKGKNSKSCSQSVSIRNDATGAFVVADQQTVGTAEQQISFDDTDLPGPPSDYVSGTGGSGTVRVRIKCQAGKVVSLGDLMKVTYEQSP